ncbi:matrix remodeling-associated protein 8 [Ictalurus punctatus]|uniref:Matrix remodeling-associated protein 8 n=1 Tax=Ictalurus punctatus TaxID=7998 RepID=A0A2D0QG82_ICTPU|nr:matrix remodeling-associated protein 8 [Ictalurus punctatus]XP_053533582.1 matrix remodeling-associated protein 8 [Ictalurus punctatus]XP_053533583.1 matrix remodeling-associated protein 8 [Ictalurus punctatus]
MQLMSRMFLLYLLGLLTFLSVTSALIVILGHKANIPCNRSCSTVKWFRKDILVCSFAEGKFTVSPEFKGRIEFSEVNLRQGDASLTITNVEYNDRSWYVCSCDDEKGCDQYLEVLVPTPLTVLVGDKAKLNCYAETDKLTAESKAVVRWEKDDKLVVKLEHGEMVFGAGFEDRVSVSKEDYNRGDLSLTIHNVRPFDAGLYRCSCPNEKSKNPKLIELTVKDSPLDWIPAVCISVVCVFIGVAAVVLWAYRRTLCTALHSASD